MKCWNCGKDANATCIFCGRAVCKKHAKQMPYILSVYDRYKGIPKAIVVSGAIFCGECKPQPRPIEMPEME
ncbi:MAG: hypothetical protein ACE5J9_07285 [Methanosarcinales archaeon]